MGYEFEVYSNRGLEKLGELKQVYAGKSYLMATQAMMKEKELGAKYVKLEWR
jgi:hypothetical protein